MHQDAVDRGWRAVLLLASVLLAGTTSRVAGEEVGVEVKPVCMEKLPKITISQIAYGNTSVPMVRRLRAASRDPNKGRNACTSHSNRNAR